MTANRGIWKLYHGSMPIVNTRVICQLWYMAVTHTMAVVTPQFAQWADSGLRCICYIQAVPLIVIVLDVVTMGYYYTNLC